MLEQIEEGGDAALWDYIQSLLKDVRTSVPEIIERFPVSPVPPMDCGSSSGYDSSVLAIRGPSGFSSAELLQDIKQTQLRRVINRSLIVTDTNETALFVAGAIGASIASNRHSGTSSFVAFVPHQGTRPHVHVWHDCNPIQNMCKCVILNHYRGKPRSEGMLATRKSIKGFRPLRSIPTEEARKAGDPYLQRLFKYVLFQLNTIQL